MAKSRALKVPEKKELAGKEEKTIPATYYVPNTDIFKSDDALMAVMEMPGVERKDVDVRLESDVLRVEGHIDLSKYEGLEPIYTEYNVGHYARAFTLSDKNDHENISADLEDGVLTLTLKKSKQALPRRIAIG